MLACWAAFAAALVGFAIATRNANLGFPGYEQPVLAAAAYVAIELLTGIAGLCLLAGAAPLARRCLAQARREPTIRRLVAVPALAGVGFAVAAGLLAVLSVVVSDHGRAVAAPHAVGVLCCLIGLLGGGVAVRGCRAALLATSVSPARLAASLVCGRSASLAMIATTAATAIYAIVLPVEAPQAAAAPAGLLRVLSVEQSVRVDLAGMLIATILAVITTRHGWSARRASDRAARAPF